MGTGLSILGEFELIYIAAGYSTYNGHFSIVLRRSFVPFLVNDALVRCAYVSGSAIHS